jgi:hypothetical protein
MTFEYLKYNNPADPNAPALRLPVIPILLTYKNKQQSILALIDSGADVCVFHSSIGKTLGIDVSSGRPETLGGISGTGHEITAYFHLVRLTVAGLNSIDLEVGFTDSDGIYSGLLGQQGFFDEYEVRFLRFKDQIEIYPR